MPPLGICCTANIDRSTWQSELMVATAAKGSFELTAADTTGGARGGKFTIIDNGEAQELFSLKRRFGAFQLGRVSCICLCRMRVNALSG